MKLLKKLLTSYLVDYPKLVAYMWQASEYRQLEAIKWWLRIGDFRDIQKRGTLVATPVGKTLRLITNLLTFLYSLLSTLTILYFLKYPMLIVLIVLSLLVAYPLYLVLSITVPVYIFKRIVIIPRQRALITRAKAIFAQHPGVLIAVAGSYGKTTMKELLGSVLASENVVFTEGNKNTIESIARFALTLKGNEKIVVVELGEGMSGDVSRMTAMVQPDYAIVTGLAPNHLDGYKDIDDIVHDFMALLAYVGKEKAYINADNELLVNKLSTHANFYDHHGSLGRRINNVNLHVNHTSFILKNDTEELHISTNLIGRHNVAVIAFVAGFARMMGVEMQEVEYELSKIHPYEHRMEPRSFHGAWLIDDTYNGSIEGMKAGLRLLAELKTKGKKIYVTPGLVDQGSEEARVHAQLGQLISAASPDEVYLMKNKVVDIIKDSLESYTYTGRIKVVEEPLDFYQNLDNIVAKDDIVMCQNDSPDYYN